MDFGCRRRLLNGPDEEDVLDWIEQDRVGQIAMGHAGYSQPSSCSRCLSHSYEHWPAQPNSSNRPDMQFRNKTHLCFLLWSAQTSILIRAPTPNRTKLYIGITHTFLCPYFLLVIKHKRKKKEEKYRLQLSLFNQSIISQTRNTQSAETSAIMLIFRPFTW